MLVLYENHRNHTIDNKINYICHKSTAKNIPLKNKCSLWQANTIPDWNIPEKLYLENNTKNLLNFRYYVNPFFNHYFSIWHHHTFRGPYLYILRRKIIKLLTEYKKCPEEPIYLYKSNLFCMLQKFLIDIFPGKYLENSYEEISKKAILFFLAEKYKINVRIQLILMHDSFGNPVKYHLSVVRIKNKTDLTYEDFFRQKYKRFKNNKKRLRVVGDRIYSKKIEIKQNIQSFNTKEYECNLRFLVQNNITDIPLLEPIHEFNLLYDEYRPKDALQDVIIAQNII